MEFKKQLKISKLPKNIAVKLTAKGEHSVVRGHPWIFSNSIIKINQDANTGDLAIIFDKNKNRVIGIGLYDAKSPIRIKMIHNAEAKATINNEFFHQKIQHAFNKRVDLLRTETNSYRLIYGENDGFPSLIADVYNKVLVIKLYSEIWLPYLEGILKG